MRLKFYCTEVSQTLNGGKIKFSPAQRGSQENEKIFRNIPEGLIEFKTKKEAIQQFTPGKGYYVDFTPVD